MPRVLIAPAKLIAGPSLLNAHPKIATHPETNIKLGVQSNAETPRERTP